MQAERVTPAQYATRRREREARAALVRERTDREPIDWVAVACLFLIGAGAALLLFGFWLGIDSWGFWA